MRLLLDAVYLLGGVLALPWILYRLAATGDWRGFGARLGAALPQRVEQGGIWLHGASVGEVTLLRPLIERLERERPEVPLLISSFTAAGLATARKAYPRHHAFLLPLDLSPVVGRFLSHFAPRLVVITESELWPNLLEAARRRNVPVAVLNAKMSAKAQRLHARIGLLPRVLRGVDLVAAQDEGHAARFAELGVAPERLAVTGNMKYDLTRAEARDGDALRAALRFGAGDVVVIGGSLHEGEEQALLEAARTLAEANPRLAGSLALIIVPRYPADAQRVERCVREHGLEPVRKSTVDRGDAAAPGRAGILVVDTLGELAALYAAADVAFVGGSLFYRGSNKGGHNLMEPAVRGVPVLFGPYNFSFRETVAALLEAEAGVMVRDHRELAHALAMLLGDAPGRRAMGERARRVVLDRQGATERNYRLLNELLSGERLPAYAPRRTMPRPPRHPDSS